jgi:lipopolysaccharide transport system ATP-binding protein
MAAVESMCGSALLLAEGQCVTHGNTPVVVQEYLRDMNRASATPLVQRADRAGTGDLRFISLLLEGSHGSPVSAFQCGNEGTLHLILENNTRSELRNLRIALGIDNEMGQRVALLDTVLLGSDLSGILPGRGHVLVVVPKMALMPGRYRVTLYSTINGVIADWIKNAASFDVESGDYYGTGQLPEHGQGMFLMEHRFVASPGGREVHVGNALKSATMMQ